MQLKSVQIHSRPLALAAAILSGVWATTFVIINILWRPDFNILGLGYFNMHRRRILHISSQGVLDLFLLLSVVAFTILVIAFPKKIRLVTFPIVMMLLFISINSLYFFGNLSNYLNLNSNYFYLLNLRDNWSSIFNEGLMYSMPFILSVLLPIIIAIIFILPASWSEKRWTLPIILIVITLASLMVSSVFPILWLPLYHENLWRGEEHLLRVIKSIVLLPVFFLLQSFRERRTDGVYSQRQSVYTWGFSLIALVTVGIIFFIRRITILHRHITIADNSVILDIVPVIFLIYILITTVVFIIFYLSEPDIQPTRDIALVIIFMLLFGWIYLPLWIFMISASLPSASRKPPVVHAILSLLIPFYSLWWLHRHSQELHRKFITDNRPINDFTALHTIMYFIFPLVGVALFQSKVNEYFYKANKVPLPISPKPFNTEVSTAYSGTSSALNTDSIEQIRALHNLKEQGILSEEEFQTKKTEILSKI